MASTSDSISLPQRSPQGDRGAAAIRTFESPEQATGGPFRSRRAGLISNLQRIQERLNRIPLRGALGIYLLFYIAMTLSATAPYGFNPSALIRFGHYYIRQNRAYTPDGAIRFLGNEENGGNGYDGQIFYYYARTLYRKGSWPEGFSNAYRAPRAGYPLLAGLFSLFGSWGTVAGMILVQLLTIGGAVAALYKLLAPERRYLLYFFIFSPFTLQSYTLLVSDGVMISLVVMGYYFFRRWERLSSRSGTGPGLFGFCSGSHSSYKIGSGPEESGGPGAPVSLSLAILFFSLAVLTKESSLFLLFPLGLCALLRRNLIGILTMLSVLLPMFLWQFYLREVHGMVPAGILKIFLSPLDGILGLGSESIGLLGGFLSHPSASALLPMIKASARWLLFLMILATLLTLFKQKLRGVLPIGLAAALTLLSVLVADHYYFWSVYENISRMFTILVPIMILLKNEEPKSDTAPFFLTLALLSLMVVARILLLSPSFPFDHYHPYRGPSYETHAPLPPSSVR